MTDVRSFTHRLLAVPIACILVSLLGFKCPGPETEEIVLPGLTAPVSVIYDRDGVPHIRAENDLDLTRVEGYVHARDRFFQMDATRREVSGDLAELLGDSRLGSDIQNRTIGLRRAAERSAALLSADEAAAMQAYADGVNAWLAEGDLPPEYALLELTGARPWDTIDSLSIGKAISASLSLDIDVGPTLQLQSFIQAGILGGFDGQALFFQDVVRSAPMDPASTVPDATNDTPYLAKILPKVNPSLLARQARGAERIRDKLEAVPFLAQLMHRDEMQIGSNEWGIAGQNSWSGRPIIANDPHLSLNAPSTFYEWHLRVDDDPLNGEMNVSGVGFPGTPGVILGQNQKVTWGATTNPMDVSDIFLDELHFLTPDCLLIGALACIHSEGVFHPVEIEFASYSTNVLGDGIDDNIVEVPLPLEQTIIATAEFRSFGPILDITDPGVIPGGGITTALILQYTGFHGTRELQTFVKWNRAENLADFLDGLADFDAGSQNWAYADVDGNLAYFSSAELPLRMDLEQGVVIGVPPAFIRDGSGPNNWVPDPAHSQGQTIPYAILPADEMPQALNPENGFFVNANNDPAGTTLDNDPLNQVRPSKPTAIYYLNPSYSNGLRAGRITRLIENHLDHHGAISVHDMKRFQANTQQLDAELMTPFLLAAFENATDPGAPSELADLADDPRVAEAVGRLADWDFSTPTGIPEGWDAHDNWGHQKPGISESEARASVAATIYNLWRAKTINAVVDSTLASVGVGTGSSDALKALHHLLVQDPFTGVGASGVDFLPQPASLSDAEDRRDYTLLAALQTALDVLASSEFAAAFGESTDQDDYRWGRLHRITFDHAFDPALSIPPQSGFEHLSPELLGLSRDGGYEVVNASGFSARASGVNSFRFGGGPVRRYVGQPSRQSHFHQADIQGYNVMPGGPSGVPGDPDYATQLPSWLTADYHRVMMGEPMRSGQTSRESFVPEP
ncbi:MAG: penicillin acylase family protein [Deltaproteobacteria bacterium]|nr:penicillin acylase family protein [Deltaproteobacteria bacterium]